MRVTQQAVRAYRSSAYFADQQIPRLDPLGGRPVVIDPYPLIGQAGRAKLYLGAPAPEIVDANRVRLALSGPLLEALTGGQPLDPDIDRVIEDALARLDTSESGETDWYLTLIVEQDIDVPDSLLIARRYYWFADDLFARTRAFRAVATPELDMLALLATTVLEPQVFETVAVEDRVYFSAPGRVPCSAPEARLSGNGSVRRHIRYLDVDALRARAEMGATFPPDARRVLEAVVSWWLTGLRETDPWRAFMQFFIGLESLHGRMGRRCYDRAVTGARMQGADQAAREGTPLLAALLSKKKEGKGQILPKSQLEDSAAAEFAALALALRPASADDDFATFSRMKTLRNDLVHGKKQVSGVAFPVADLRDLLRRYIDAAIDDYRTTSS